MARRENQRRLDIRDPVSKPALVSCATIVRLIGMNHERASADTVPRRAAIPEDLNPQRGGANGIRVVPVG